MVIIINPHTLFFFSSRLPLVKTTVTQKILQSFSKAAKIKENKRNYNFKKPLKMHCIFMYGSFTSIKVKL